MQLEIHSHNDFGMATANSLAAVRAGATRQHYGEWPGGTCGQCAAGRGGDGFASYSWR